MCKKSEQEGKKRENEFLKAVKVKRWQRKK